jgi:hypothetical protein
MCDSHQQAANYYIFGPKFGASSVTHHLAGIGVKVFSFWKVSNQESRIYRPDIRNEGDPIPTPYYVRTIPKGRLLYPSENYQEGGNGALTSVGSMWSVLKCD